MELLPLILNECNTLLNLIKTHNILHLEIFFSLVNVSMVLILTFLGLKFNKIQECFDKHECNIEPKGFQKTWEIYFSAPLMSANGICMWRIYASIPLAISIAIFYQNQIVSFILIQFYVFLFATDALDGAVARELNNITTIGKSLDPLGDKILVLPILAIVSYYSDNILFLSLTMLIIFFDSLGQLLRGKTKNPAANWIGKIKTIITMISIYILSLNRYDVNLDYISGILLLITLYFTFWSFYRKLSLRMRSKTWKFTRKFIKKKVAE